MVPHFFVSKWRALLCRCRSSNLATLLYVVITCCRQQGRRGCPRTVFLEFFVARSFSERSVSKKENDPLAEAARYKM